MDWWRYVFPFTALTAIGAIGATLISLLVTGNYLTGAFVLAFGWFVATPIVGILELMSILGWSPIAALRSNENPDPIEELHEAYVSGELSEEEFERRVGELLDTDENEEPSPSGRSRSIELE